MNLGQLAVTKLAQDEGGFFSDLRATQGAHVAPKPQFGLEASPQSATGVSTQGQLGVQAAGLFGEVPQEIAQFLMMMAQMFGGPEIAKRLNSTIRFPGIYGGNKQLVDEYQAVVQQTMQVNNQQLGKDIKRFGSDLAKTVVNAAKSWGINLPAGVEQQIAGFLQQAPDSMVGFAGSMLGSIFPEAKNMLAAFAPNIMWDDSAIRNATYQVGNGKFDINVYKNLLNQVNHAYATGQVPKGITKQVMTEAVAAATKMYGPNINMSVPINLATAADSFVTNGVAQNFGDALVMMEGFNPKEIMQNPQRAVQYAGQIGEALHRGLVSREQLQGAVQMSKQQGMPVAHALKAVTQSGQIAKGMAGGVMSPDRVKGLQNEYVRAIMETPNTQQFKLLAAVHATGGENTRKNIELALKNGDTGYLRQVMNRARYNPRAMQAREFVDTSVLASQMAPEAMQSWAQMDAMDIAKYQHNPQLAQMLRNPNEVARRLKEQDFSGLNQKTIRALSTGAGGGSLPALFMTQARMPKAMAPRTPVPGQLGAAGLAGMKAVEDPAIPSATPKFNPTPVNKVPGY